MPGELPQDWSWKRLGEHFTRITRRNVAGVRRVLTASGDRGLIDQEEFFNKRVAGADLSTYLHIKNGEFAYNRSAMAGYPVGAVKRLDRYSEGVVSSLYLCFGRSETATVDLDFAAQVLDSRILEDELRPIAKVGARAHGLLNVSADDFMSVLFPTPPLPEQKKIAAILRSADEAIQATQTVIDQTRRVKEGLLQDLLTRGLPGHRRFKQTEIGEIPESWEVRRVEDVCGRVGVGIAASATHAYRDRGVPLIRNQNIKYGYLDLSDLLYIDENYDRENHTKRLHTGDVITIRTGYPGVSAVVPSTLNNAQSFTTLVSSPNPNLIRSEFLATWINGPVGRRLVLAGEAGGAQHNLDAGELKRLPVALPALSEQDGIISILASLSEAEMREQKVLRRLGHARSGLLQDLLTGKVRVSP